MTENTFTIGDTVSLRSGGTAMTVDEMKPDGVRCTWMDESGEDRAAIFNPACLARIKQQQVWIERNQVLCIWVFAESGFPITDRYAILPGPGPYAGPPV